MGKFKALGVSLKCTGVTIDLLLFEYTLSINGCFRAQDMIRKQ